jgi:type I restriction enzyme S subunit
MVSGQGVVRQSDTGRKDRSSEDRNSYKRIQKGDLGYNVMNAFMGSIGFSDYDGILSPAYAVGRPLIDICHQYFDFLFRTPMCLIEFDRYSYGIMYERNRLYFENFAKISVPIPPIEEQKAIARYLDRKLAEIDLFIQNKQRLIELLKEQKAALIDRAVTKGIDDGVRMRLSGVEWVDEIPECWEVKRVKNLIKFITSGSRGWSEYCSDDSQNPLFLQSGHLGDNLNVDLRSPQYVSPPIGAEGERGIIKQYDILICITGAKTGNVAIVRDPLPTAYINQHVALVRPYLFKIDFRFLGYFLKSSVGSVQFLMSQYGGTKPGLSFNDVKDIIAFCPPLHEQNEIADFLDAKTLEIESLISKQQQEIELIQEYQVKIISDAVTGKIYLQD